MTNTSIAIETIWTQVPFVTNSFSDLGQSPPLLGLNTGDWVVLFSFPLAAW